MTDTLRAACIQMTSGPNMAVNLAEAERLIRRAIAEGAQFIATPENTCQIRHPATEKLKTAMVEDKHPGIPMFSKLASGFGVWLLAGSFSIKVSDRKIANRSFLFAPDGTIAAQYDKIHLFDADLSAGEQYRESDIVEPGNKLVVAETPWGGVGLSICYDLRFAYHYRSLAHKGAAIMTVPAAFTVPTGKAHWEILLRARAIETGSFVIAPAQTGEHDNGRRTWGHSMIIDPWGNVLADGGAETGIIIADLAMQDVEKARRSIPALKHDRTHFQM
ncbi:MAG: carbon-nitrogen hydrolase family protein [Alphaproteobacteria bacterium]